MALTGLIPAIFILLSIFTKLTWPDIYTNIIQEDSGLEYLQAIFNLITAFFFLISSRKFLLCNCRYDLIFSAILGIFFIFITLEEISWGQRILKFETSALMTDLNLQNEMTLHNLYFVQKKLPLIVLLVSAFLSFGWTLRHLKSFPKKHYIDFISKYIPSSKFTLFFIPGVLLNLFFIIAPPDSKGIIVWRDQEPVEFLMALGLLLFSYQFSRAKHFKVEQTTIQNS